MGGAARGKEAVASLSIIGGVFEEGGEGRRGWRRARRAGAEAVLEASQGAWLSFPCQVVGGAARGKGGCSISEHHWWGVWGGERG